MENIKTVVCKNFNTLFLKSGISQKSLAGMLKVHTSTLQRWQSGLILPGFSNLEKLAEIFNVDPIVFYQIEEPVEPKVVELPISKTLQKLMNVPDDVYDLAEKYGPDHEVWKDIRKAFEIYEMGEERKRAKEKSRLA